jgi:hypothetical protein
VVEAQRGAQPIDERKGPMEVHTITHHQSVSWTAAQFLSPIIAVPIHAISLLPSVGLGYGRLFRPCTRHISVPTSEHLIN